MKQRYEIRMSVQMKKEFLGIGGDANTVRTMIEDYIIRANNEIICHENSNPIWNYYDMSVQTNEPLYKKITDDKGIQHYVCNFDIRIIESSTGEKVRVCKSGSWISKKIVEGKKYTLRRL